uniref:c-Myc-binding protein n=1 Tax=Aegilops tauschii subsp. strangulata TaxID=200361 RepID=A0A453D767_AEGTS
RGPTSSTQVGRSVQPPALPRHSPPTKAPPQICYPGSATEMDREAKKEGFRKYLESSGVLDTLTKALVALYEENDKPSSAVEFVQQKLGGPSISDYEKLKAEKLDLQLKYNELLETHKETSRQVNMLSCLQNTPNAIKEYRLCNATLPIYMGVSVSASNAYLDIIKL